MALRHFNEIASGAQFPPRRELPRVQVQDRWAQRFAGVFEDSTRRLKPNIYRYLATFWADHVISDPPLLIYGEFDAENPQTQNTREQEALNLISASISAECYRCMIDLVKYGSAVLKNDIPFSPNSLDPRLYYRVIRPEIGIYEGAVSCSTFKVEETGNMPDRIIVTQHEADSFMAKRTIYGLQGLSIQSPMSDMIEIPAAHPVLLSLNDVQPHDDVIGVSAYHDIDDYVQELHRRESAVSEALDRHVAPHLAVPEGVLRTDAAGNAELSSDGEAITVPEGGTTPTYVTWEPDFTAHENAMSRALERIQRMTGIAPVLAGTSDTINTPSGSALRRLAMVTVTRIRTFRSKLDVAIRTVCAENMEVARLSGIDAPVLDPEQINVLWSPPLAVAGEEDEGVPSVQYEYRQGG